MPGWLVHQPGYYVTDEETEEEKEKKRLKLKAREEFFAAIKIEGQ